jgi:hypothetical protein
MISTERHEKEDGVLPILDVDTVLVVKLEPLFLSIRMYSGKPRKGLRKV